MYLMSDVDWRLSVERPPAGDHGGSDRDRTESDDLRQNQGSHSLRWSVHTAVLPKLNVAVASDLEQTARAHGPMLEAAESGDAEAFRAAITAHYEPIMRALEQK